jgi:hypothetical protein
VVPAVSAAVPAVPVNPAAAAFTSGVKIEEQFSDVVSSTNEYKKRPRHSISVKKDIHSRQHGCF